MAGQRAATCAHRGSDAGGAAAAGTPPALAWNVTLGGSGSDGAAAVNETSDGGYIVAGQTSSSDGDVGFNHGGQDGWVVKLDADGGIAWNRTLGGSGSDGVYAVDQAFDGGFVVAGSTTSSDGDVAGNRGGYDCWAVKLDADGGMAWNATLGGSLGDGASAVRQASDGGYVVAGFGR